MKNSSGNPFNITKAVDFSDQEIHDYWVDLSDSGGFVQLMKPTSHMPMLILGGKGSGKTHLMRYFSYSLQKVRHQDRIIDGLTTEQYLGIYLRCSGLNASRFRGKGLNDDTWEAVFSYYMELWLSQLVIENVLDAFKDSDELKDNERLISNSIIELFDVFEGEIPLTLPDTLSIIREIQRKLDYAVNNCAITRKLEVEILATRGRLIFGIPKVFSQNLPSLKNCLFLYLIDEFENLKEPQQKYINTIIREKESPCSFKIGSRLYGVKTYDTYTEGETNKVDSEFEAIHLDDILRTNINYSDYAARLIASRFVQCRYPTKTDDIENTFCTTLNTQFERLSDSEYYLDETKFIIEKYEGRERPYFISLKANLSKGLKNNTVLGVESEDDIKKILNNLYCPEYPLLEKTNVFLLYRYWYKNKISLVDASSKISEQCKNFLSNTSKNGSYKTALGHFKSDLLSQLLRECGRDRKYFSLATLIEMSWGLPRNLLVLLKNIFAWSLFYGESPFEGTPISIKAQNNGVIESSDWFFSDAKISGKMGTAVRDSIDRLGNFFREIRFSDKPSECSCVSFSADIAKANTTTRELIKSATDYSLLIEVGTQSDKNTGRIRSQYQLNRMIAPRWGLAIYRRGTIALNVEELDEIFSPGGKRGALDKRISGMTAPLFGKKKTYSKKSSIKQITWPGASDD